MFTKHICKTHTLSWTKFQSGSILQTLNFKLFSRNLWGPSLNCLSAPQLVISYGKYFKQCNLSLFFSAQVYITVEPIVFAQNFMSTKLFQNIFTGKDSPTNPPVIPWFPWAAYKPLHWSFIYRHVNTANPTQKRWLLVPFYFIFHLTTI